MSLSVYSLNNSSPRSSIRSKHALILPISKYEGLVVCMKFQKNFTRSMLNRYLYSVFTSVKWASFWNLSSEIFSILLSWSETFTLSVFLKSINAAEVNAGIVLCRLVITISAPFFIALSGNKSWNGKCAPWAPSTISTAPCLCAVSAIAVISDTIPSYVGDVITTALIPGLLINKSSST